MNLLECTSKDAGGFVVTSVNVPDTHRLRLAELGIRPGASVRVVKKASGGGQIVGLGTSRIALDKSTCRQIVVDVVGG